MQAQLVLEYTHQRECPLHLDFTSILEALAGDHFSDSFIYSNIDSSERNVENLIPTIITKFGHNQAK